MSRIGKQPVPVPNGVDVTIDGQNVSVKGPKGTLELAVAEPISVSRNDDGAIVVTRPDDERRNRSLHGLSRTLVANLVTGVTEGYTIKMEIFGVGYRVVAKGSNLEFALGYKRPEMLRHAAGPEARAAIERRLAQRSVVDHFYDFLETQGATIPPELRAKDTSAANAPSPELQREILRLYKARPELAILFELMTDLDEGFQEWKYRHVKLVERTIGNKKGTGGSLGVEFLKQSLFKPIFPDLWAIRHEL